MHQRIPEAIRAILEEYIALLENELPGFMNGFYIHGSVALDAFNAHFSDIDFVTVISRRCSQSDVEKLKQIHQTLAGKYPHWALEGSYLQWDDLGRLEDAIDPYPTYHGGTIRFDTRLDGNSVTWWVLKNRGIALMGPEPHDLDFRVDWDLLIAWTKENLNIYWARFTTKPSRIAWLFTDYGIQWTVLGVLRQLYTVKEHDIASKTGAGEYALTQMPMRWHRLIREAVNIREQKNASFYKSRIVRAIEALGFLKYVIRLCNTLSG